MPRPRIVIALDPERVSPEAIELGHALGLATGAPLTLLAVWHWWEPVELAMLAGQSLRDEAYAVLRAIGDRLRTRGHDVAERVLAGASIGSALHDAARRPGTGLIVMGPAHRGTLGRALAGSTAADFLHGAPCPVAVAPRGYGAPDDALRRVGVAFVDTDDGREALRAGVSLARRAGAQVKLIAVAETYVPPAALVPGWGVPELLAERHALAERAAEAAADELRMRDEIDIEPVVLDGDPVSALAAASAELDLLVCGSRGYGPLGAVLLGGVSRPLLSRATRPLLVIPRGRELRLERLLENPSTAGFAG